MHHLKRIHKLRERFEQRFLSRPRVFQAPGRVNLIGEHTDYHEGYVLPMAIERSIALVGRRRADRTLRLYSRVLRESTTLDIDATERHPERWARYFQGVVQVLGARHPLDAGADVLIDADLPPGGGLSSSSALVVGFAALLARVLRHHLGPGDHREAVAGWESTLSFDYWHRLARGHRLARPRVRRIVVRSLLAIASPQHDVEIHPTLRRKR